MTTETPATTGYKVYQAEALQILDAIRSTILRDAEKQSQNPTEWGFVSDMKMVVRDLRGVLSDLTLR